MKPAGRVQAAIEVLEDVETRHRPASVALADWGRNHRFAGSSDRAAIGNLVYDALRKRLSIAHRMASDSPRALAFGTLATTWEMPPDAIAAMADGSKFAPDSLTDDERQALTAAPASPPAHVAADVPEWLWPRFESAFEDDAVAEGQALATRAPLDLRTNTIKANREKVLKALAHSTPQACTISPLGVRVPPPPATGRTPNVTADAGFQKGWFEVQDEGSQIVAQLVGAKPGEQVLDYCAGAGGKTLALAAEMENKGQLHAWDADKHRLAPIYDRVKRAGLRNVQIHAPDDPLDALTARMHRVVIDAPCTGTGVWRRRPDAKWRLTAEALEARKAEQREILESARTYVRPGGFLCYITCSVLADENEAQVHGFLKDHPDFELVTVEEVWRERFGLDKPAPWSSDTMTITLTPAATGTDGFFFAVMERRGEV